MLPWILISTLTAASANIPIHVAITFDDLPGDEVNLKAIQEVLSRYQLPPATGFVNGFFLKEKPSGLAALRDWVAAGHLLGNHTYSHLHLEQVSAAIYKDDIDRNEPLLRQATDDSTSWRIFRYPYLEQGASQSQRDEVLAHLATKTYRVAEVTIDAYDWAWNKVYERCLAQQDTATLERLHQGFIEDALAQLRWSTEAAKQVFGGSIYHILLLHSRALTAAYLGELVTAFMEQGVVFVPLALAMSDWAYLGDPGNSLPSRGNYLNRVIRAQNIRGVPKATAHPVAWMEEQCRDESQSY